ncbi:MAG: hypothetical protein II200_02235 [Bacteroidaceae bacterium]|nr:hypothetical protein [Bacteroidaceae bacterium]
MRTISNLRVKGLYNNELLGYLLRALSCTEALIKSEDDKPMVDAFRNAVLAYDAAIKQRLFKHETQAVVDAGNRAQQIYRGFVNYTESMLHHPRAEKAKVAVKVKDIIDKYGGLNHLSVNNRYAILYSVLQDVNELSSDDQASLYLSEWIEGLTLATEEFRLALDVQNIERARYQKGLVKETRLKAEEAYAVFTNSVNACAILKGDECYDNLIDNLNAMISVLKTTLKARSTRSENNKSKDEAEGNVDTTTPEVESESAA